jgi:hypothetical protein
MTDYTIDVTNRSIDGTVMMRGGRAFCRPEADGHNHGKLGHDEQVFGGIENGKFVLKAKAFGVHPIELRHTMLVELARATAPR